MNIGMEAKRAFVNSTGLGQYSRTLVTTLATQFPDHNYLLFTPKRGNYFSTDLYPNMSTELPQDFLSRLMPSMWRSNWVTKDLLRLKVDIFHGLSHELPYGIHKTGIPAVVTIHDLIHERFPNHYPLIDRKIYTKKFKYACTNANHIIAISEQTKKDIVEFYHINPGKISVCYQSCNESFGVTIGESEKQIIKEKYRLPEKYLLYVGSIIERKNLMAICRALNMLKSEMRYPLVVIGQGKKYYEEVRAYLKENNLESQVIFLSYQSKKEFGSNVPFAEMPAIYQMASMLIYPSYYEGFGIPVLEGLLSRIPVITSNVSCLPEAGGEAAFYVNPHNVNELSSAILTSLNNHELVRQRIEIGIKYAEKFENNIAASRVMQVYELLL